jgi:hypothetical protein
VATPGRDLSQPARLLFGKSPVGNNKVLSVTSPHVNKLNGTLSKTAKAPHCSQESSIFHN